MCSNVNKKGGAGELNVLPHHHLPRFNLNSFPSAVRDHHLRGLYHLIIHCYSNNVHETVPMATTADFIFTQANVHCVAVRSSSSLVDTLSGNIIHCVAVIFFSP